MKNKHVATRIAGYLLFLGVGMFSVSLATKMPETSLERVQRIYNNLVLQTGNSEMIPPITVANTPMVNAYNTNEIIVIYQGLISATKNDDELALVIGHEMAHSTLMHFDFEAKYAYYQSIREAQADKLGAYYIMRAGYDLCKARQFWLTMIRLNGDYLGGDHPGFSYRYSQLNIGCGEF